VVPWPAAVMEPAAVPTDMPEMEPVDTVPVEVMLLMVVLLITPVDVPEDAFGSSGAVNEPDSVPMLTLLVVPWPAAVMAPPLVPTDMPEMEPVDTVPVEVMLLMVVLLITPVDVPEGAFGSSGAVNEPDRVPILTLLVVPWPAARMAAPEVTLSTFMPTIEPANTRPEI